MFCENIQIGKWLFFGAAVGQHLVGCDRYRLDSLGLCGSVANSVCFFIIGIVGHL